MKKITTSIPEELWQKAKKAGWKWHELLSFAIVNKEQMLTELRELRIGNTKIQTKLTEFSTRIYKLEERVVDLEQWKDNAEKKFKLIKPPFSL